MRQRPCPGWGQRQHQHAAFRKRLAKTRGTSQPGIDVAIEALKEGWKERRFTVPEINSIAKTCNAATVLSPYLEAVIG